MKKKLFTVAILVLYSFFILSFSYADSKGIVEKLLILLGLKVRVEKVISNAPQASVQDLSSGSQTISSTGDPVPDPPVPPPPPPPKK